MESKSWFSLVLCCYILASFIFSSHGRVVSRMLLQEVGESVEAPANPPLPAGVGQDSEMAEDKNGNSKAGVKPSQPRTSSSRNGQNSPATESTQQVSNTPPAFPFSRSPPRNSQSVVRNGRQTVTRNGRQSVVTNGNSQSVVTNGEQTVVRNGGQMVVMNRNGQSSVYNSPAGESTEYVYPPPPPPTTGSMEYSTPLPAEQSSTEGPTEACNSNNADCDP